ncbi:MAG: glycoside hydrolase family 127 protein [Verrucomicrobiota bacterium]
MANGEAYGADYELPNNCYNETCAAVGFLFWNHRMFLLSGQARYMDVFERTLYNGFLSGVSLSGDRFFYPNPLEWDGKSKFNHGTAGRAPWFGCACCPPNVLRLLASLGGYAYAVQDTNLFVNLYASSDSKAELRGQKVSVLQSTDYPWSGEVRLTVTPQREQTFCLCLRIPGWVNGKPLPSDLYHYEDATPASWKISINGKPVTAPVVDGYARLARAWKPGDRVDLSMAMPVRRVLGNPKIQATRGLVALERGPVVYCLEGVDNPGRLLNAVLPAGASIRVVPRPELLGGVTVLEIQDAKRVPVDPASKAPSQGLSLTAIPYATWNNRGASPMTVWMAEDPTAARQDF